MPCGVCSGITELVDEVGSFSPGSCDSGVVASVLDSVELSIELSEDELEVSEFDSELCDDEPELSDEVSVLPEEVSE